MIDQKRKEFLELKQGSMSVTDYERKFVRLSKYARECVSSEAVMCKRFEDGLNEDIKMFVGVLEIREFVVLVERACKAEELRKEKQRVDEGTGEFRKRSSGRSLQQTSKRFRDDAGQFRGTSGLFGRDRSQKHKNYQKPSFIHTLIKLQQWPNLWKPYFFFFYLIFGHAKRI